MSAFEHLQIKRDDRGVATVTIDAVGRPVNVFDEALLCELQKAVDQLETETTLRLIVFRSGKHSGFLAGADVHRIQEIATTNEAAVVLSLGQQLFNRVESLSTPTLAVIHGPCLGGGLEFALACRHRVARDESNTRIGLPETQLGLIPAWGGTQRLPRTVGVSGAIRMILEGRRISAADAVRLGLVDASFPQAEFDEDLEKFIDDLLQGRTPQRRSVGWKQWLQDETALGRLTVFWLARRGIAQQGKRYPALPAALRCIEAGTTKGIQTGLDREREEFCKLLFQPECRHLLNLFLLREQARKRSTWVGDETRSVTAIESLGVIGAGTMGAGIAQLAAISGFSVVLQDVSEELVQKGKQRVHDLTQQAVRKGAIDAAQARQAMQALHTGTGPESLQSVDLVVEAIVERLDVKQQVFRTLDEQLDGNVLFASNTSALPISEMAAVTGRGGQMAGLHFFNPVHKMPLVEVVRCPATSDMTIAALVDVVRRLGKTPLVVREGPGFLVNRILFPYLDEAIRMVCEGLPVDQIDRAAKRFGMPMGPLQLLDTVGLDVAADVSQTLASLSLEESPTPLQLAEMVTAGHKGQKTGQGFYTYRGNRRRKPVEGIGSSAAAMMPEEVQFAGESFDGITQRLVFAMMNSAAGTLQDGIVGEDWMVDLGMVLGTGFAPFRGGPMAVVESWGRDDVKTRLEQLSEICGPRFRPSPYFEDPATRQRENLVKVTARDQISS